MKKLFIMLFAIAGSCLSANAKDDNCEVSLTVEVAESPDGIPTAMHERLTAMLRRAVTQNGIEGGDKLSNFNLVATTHETSKEMLAGTRPTVAITYELRLYVSNMMTNEKFASSVIYLNGAGLTEGHAARAAVSSVNGQNRPIQLFLQDAHRRILAFYDNQAPLIIRQAKQAASQYDFERAMFLLQTIPACSKQYDKAEKAMKEVFQQFIDRDCSDKIAKARNIWNATQNRQGALLAGAYLAGIDPNSSCTNDAKKLEKAISERIGDEWEFAKEMMRDSMKLEEKYIDALKVIGKAYGKNQGDMTVVNVDGDDYGDPIEAKPEDPKPEFIPTEPGTDDDEDDAEKEEKGNQEKDEE